MEAAEINRTIVSIHAPREGCDARYRAKPPLASCFNSRTPGGVRPYVPLSWLVRIVFQFTHPGRGATFVGGLCPSLTLRFNSRTPGGVRLTAHLGFGYGAMFQFTHPGRGAARKPRYFTLILDVSIHAPREGCDVLSDMMYLLRSKFQFTHPGRGATWNTAAWSVSGRFQFTHPGRGATAVCRHL